MKVGILVSALVLSVLLNAAGIVFFCLYLGQIGHVKTIKRENNQLRNNLTLVRSAGAINDLSTSDRLARRYFISNYDGKEDFFAVSPAMLPPTTDVTLIVYLHGMGSTYQEPFIFPKDQPIAFAIVDRLPHTVVLSLSYRKQASWGSDAAISDITQNIRELCQQYPVKRIVLMGSSMGGSVALTYAATAPDDVKQKLKGVVSCESAGDLAKLFKLSQEPTVQGAMTAAFGGTPDQAPQIYAARSLLPNINRLQPAVRIAVISATEDKTVPPELQRDLIKALDAQGIKNKLIEIDAQHGSPPADRFLEGLDFVLGKG